MDLDLGLLRSGFSPTGVFQTTPDDDDDDDDVDGDDDDDDDEDDDDGDDDDGSDISLVFHPQVLSRRSLILYIWFPRFLTFNSQC